MILVAVIWIWPTKPEPVKSPSKKPSLAEESQFSQARFDDIIHRVAKTNVVKDVSPVVLYREVDGKKIVHAVGALMHGNGSILTCGHAFWKELGQNLGPYKFYYRVAQPFDDRYYPINRIQTIASFETNRSGVSKDVMECFPGEATLIEFRDKPQEAYPPPDSTLEFTPSTRPKFARSIFTGESAQVLGSLKNSHGVTYPILDCQFFKGLSGTVFAGEKNSGYILVMGQRLNDEEMRLIKPPSGRDVITLCVPFNFN